MGKNKLESKGENYILNIILENNRELNFRLWKYEIWIVFM